MKKKPRKSETREQRIALQWFYLLTQPDAAGDLGEWELDEWSSGWSSRQEAIDNIKWYISNGIVDEDKDIYVCPGRPYSMDRLTTDGAVGGLLEEVVESMAIAMRDSCEALQGINDPLLVTDREGAVRDLRVWVRRYIEPDVVDEPDLSQVEKLLLRGGQIMALEESAKPTG